jgi:hypothetical protein
MGATNLDFVLAEVHRARAERVARVESQDSRLALLFALSGALVALSALLPWQLALATAMFAGFAVFYASEGLRSAAPDPVDAQWLQDHLDQDTADVKAIYLKTLMEHICSLERRSEDKAWCVDMTRLFLICAFVAAGAGPVARAIEIQT